MIFTHLRLSNWRNFTKVDIALTPRAFLIGPNASGKSNLLDVFRFLRDIARLGIAKPGGGFQEAVKRRGGVSPLRCLAARRYSDIMIEVCVGEFTEKDEPPPWRYLIEFSQDNLQRAILKREKVWRQQELILDRPTEEDKRDPLQKTQTYLEQVNRNEQFRDLATFFNSIQYLHLVPHIIRDPVHYPGKSDDPFGSDFLEQLARTPEKTRNSRLEKIRVALSIAVPQLVELRLKRDEITGVPHLEGRYEHWRPKGSLQREEQFSDGTLRLLGVLWSLLSGTGPLLLEEPELSLHSAVVRRIPRLISKLQRRKKLRQVIVSTHSYDLLNDQGIGGEEVIVLQPSTEGTTVFVGKDDQQLRVLLEAGVTVADAALPKTEPKNVQQLELFG